MRELLARAGYEPEFAPRRLGAVMLAWLGDIVEAVIVGFSRYARDVYQSNLNPAGLLDRRLRPARFVCTCPEANQRFLQGRTATPVHRHYHDFNVTFVRLSAERSRPAIPSGGVRMLAAGRLVRTKGFDAGGARQ